MKYSLILLDADNTLFDYDKAERNALISALQQFGYTRAFEPILASYRHINGMLWNFLEKGIIRKEQLRTERFSRLFSAHNLSYDVVDFSERYLAQLSQGRFLVPGAKDVCEYLSKKYTLAIVTNGIREIQLSRIQGSPLRQYLHGIIVSEEVGANKPDPKIFEYTLKKMHHTDKESVLMIGDSLTSDIQGGNRFGIDTCWYNPNNVENTTSSTPTYCITSLYKLSEIV